MSDPFPNRYFPKSYFPEGYFGERETQPPVEPGAGLSTPLGAWGYGRKRKKLTAAEMRRLIRQRKRGRKVHHDEDDIIAILLALT